MAFSEGLAFTDDGRLFESTGRYGESTVRQIDPVVGRVIQERALDPGYFGEGLTAVGDTLVQLTWRESSVLRWRAEDLTPGPTGSIEGEGWGLATVDAGTLVASDGGATLTFRSAADLQPLRTVTVTRKGRPVDDLNELEVVDGAIWANIWRSNEIIRIDLDTGKVTATVDLSSIVPDGLSDPEAVLNGIAHRRGDPASRLWVTGKRWPVLYEIDVAGSLRPR